MNPVKMELHMISIDPFVAKKHAGIKPIQSWRKMSDRDLLRPVDFLKLGHHGSHNGMPDDQLDKVLPPHGRAADRHVAVSTCAGAYNEVPHESTIERLKERAVVRSTEGLAPGDHFDIVLEAANCYRRGATGYGRSARIGGNAT